VTGGELNIIEKSFLKQDIGTEKKTEGSRRDKITVLIIRWIIALIVIILSTPITNFHKHGLVYLLLIFTLLVYNSLISFRIMKVSTRMDDESAIIIYLDLIIVCVLSFFSNGVKSDCYVVIYFLISYCAIFSDSKTTFRFGLFSIAAFSLSGIIYMSVNNDFREISVLALRDVLILIGSYGVSRINHTVKMYEELRKAESKLARTDKLTGLANRHYFDQRLFEEVEYADRNNSVLNVMILDLDNFKGFNDTYGHVAGDKLLVLFSDIINQCIRKYDIPVRYGGEEFLILIREMDMVIVRSIGERIRMQLEKQRIYMLEGDEKKKVTVSCGIAQYPSHSKSIKKVIEMADQSLYYAKNTGKNVVMTYDDIMEKIANNQ
jgi:diguanylate cyclase (GGDEF)-like protein